MATPNGDDEDDDFFKEIYGKVYSGPLDSGRDRNRTPVKEPQPQQRQSSWEESEDYGPRDPNELPRDFASRESRVWDAKAKAAERNWKRRRDEEMHCRVCGEAGHFAQGCPSTLGGNARPGEQVNRILLSDRRLKSRLIGTGGAVIQGLEKSSGCKIKLEDNLGAADGSFTVHITGSSQEKVQKGTDSVNAVVQQVTEEWKTQGSRKLSSNTGRGYLSPSPASPPANRGHPIQSPAAPATHVGHATMYIPPMAANASDFAASSAPPAGAQVLHDSDQQITEQIAAQLEARRRWEGGQSGGHGGSYVAASGGMGPLVLESGHGQTNGLFVVSGMNTGNVQQNLPPSQYAQSEQGNVGENLSHSAPSSRGQIYHQELPGRTGGFPDQFSGMNLPVVPVTSGQVSGQGGSMADRENVAGYNQAGVAREAGAGPSEEDMEVGYGDGDAEQKVSSVSARTLEELEQVFLDQTMALTRAQTAAETGELARHTQRMGEIRGEYQQKVCALRSQQMRERDTFLLKQQQQAPSANPPSAPVQQQAAAAPNDDYCQSQSATYASPQFSTPFIGFQEQGPSGYVVPPLQHSQQPNQQQQVVSFSSPGLGGPGGSGGPASDLPTIINHQTYVLLNPAQSSLGNVLSNSGATGGQEVVSEGLPSVKAGLPGGGQELGVNVQYKYSGDQRGAEQVTTPLYGGAQQNGFRVENQGGFVQFYAQPAGSQPEQQYFQVSAPQYSQSEAQGFSQAQPQNFGHSLQGDGQAFNLAQAVKSAYEQINGSQYIVSQNISQSTFSQGQPTEYRQSSLAPLDVASTGTGANTYTASNQASGVNLNPQTTQSGGYSSYSGVGGSYQGY